MTVVEWENVVVTPHMVEQKLVWLGRQVNDAHTALESAESDYYEAKSDYEIAVAEARLAIGERYLAMGAKATVQEKEDEATVKTQAELRLLNTAEAKVKAARANVRRLETQVDLTRSVAANMRVSMEALS